MRQILQSAIREAILAADAFSPEKKKVHLKSLKEKTIRYC